MQPREDVPGIELEAWRITRGVAFCIATVVGKYASYPAVDPATFERVRESLESGLRKHSADRMGDVCQELRGMIHCPARELVAPRGLLHHDAGGRGGASHDESGAAPEDTIARDDAALRLIAIADVVRQRARVSQRLHKEILTGLLSWDERDRAVIFDALANIIRGC